jgi:hypothetical protein
MFPLSTHRVFSYRFSDPSLKEALKVTNLVYFRLTVVQKCLLIFKNISVFTLIHKFQKRNSFISLLPVVGYKFALIYTLICAQYC